MVLGNRDRELEVEEMKCRCGKMIHNKYFDWSAEWWEKYYCSLECRDEAHREGRVRCGLKPRDES
jgi:hypothetical protein